MCAGAAPRGAAAEFVLGENGHAEVAEPAAGSPMLVLFERLMRGVREEQVARMLGDVLEPALPGDGVALEDVFVLAVHTRWCRGGKGERAAAFALLLELYKRFPHTTTAVVALLPQFGSWRDLVVLAQESTVRGGAYLPLASACWDMLAHELDADRSVLFAKHLQRGKLPAISLAAKYAPSEHARKNQRAVRGDLELCQRLYGSTAPGARREYRRLLTHLRRALDVPETLMCAGRWDELDISAMPARALKQYKRALLNEGRGGPREQASRVRCRERLLALLRDPGAKAVKGAQLFPHELVQEALEKPCTDSVKQVLNAQWAALSARMAESGIGKARMVCMADVSGSMTGTPMHVAIGLGLLLAELSHPSFRDRVLTFSAQPQWHMLTPGADFVSRVQSLARGDWGYNTDFGAALNKIADIVRDAGMQQHEIPDLLVVSDMQFDAALGGDDAAPGAAWQLVHEQVAARFHDLGMQLHGAPLLPPQIVFWNARGGAPGLQAQADVPGVVLLSGYSPAIMQAFLSNDTREAASMPPERKTPAQALRAVLDHEALARVRDAVRAAEQRTRAPVPSSAPTPRVYARDAVLVCGIAFACCLVILCFFLPLIVLFVPVIPEHPRGAHADL